ncbi:MAG: FecR domain-containing protein [Bacteroidia bacterium]
MNQESLEDLLDRYIKGVCTEEEKKLVEAFYESFEKKESKNIIFPSGEMEMLKYEMLSKIREELSQYDLAERQALKKSPKRPLYLFAKIAAAAAFLLGSYGLFRNAPLPFTPKADNMIVSESQDFSTIRGERSKVSLSDGSVIWLNAETTVNICINPSNEIREVELSGEAFFEVAKDSSRPFVVYTGNVKTEVLGTSFNITAYDSAKPTVTVSSGKVRVAGKTSSQFVTLIPNEQVLIDTEWKKREVVSEQFSAWKNGLLTFEDMSLAEIKPILEKWYDIEIEFHVAELQNCRITGKYQNEPLKNVLESFRFIKGLDYQFVDERKIRLNGDICM